MMTVEICNADEPNKNGRVYNRETLDKIISDASVREILGTIGMVQDCSIDLSRVSHKVENLRWDGDKVIGDVTILKTEHGKILESLKNLPGIKFRTAGYGKIVLREDGIQEVTEYKLVSINVVNEPE